MLVDIEVFPVVGTAVALKFGLEVSKLGMDQPLCPLVLPDRSLVGVERLQLSSFAHFADIVQSRLNRVAGYPDLEQKLVVAAVDDRTYINMSHLPDI